MTFDKLCDRSSNAVSLRIAVVALLAGCHCQETIPARPDASIDASAVAPADATNEASVAKDASTQCRSEFLVTSGCTQPTAQRNCSGGFCRIGAGCFVMGSPTCQAGRGAYNEPEVQVTLTHDFELGEHEVTQGEWTSLGYPNPSRAPRPPDIAGACLEASCPVSGVTWYEALAFANGVSTKAGLPACYVLEGCDPGMGLGMRCTTVRAVPENLYECEGYRLPTDAEWEYAARAGTRTPYYSGPMLPLPYICQDDPNLLAVAWYCRNSPTFASHPVMQKAANAWGLYDMLGNVSEWVSNESRKSGYPRGPLVDDGAALVADVERSTRGGYVTTVSTRVTASTRLPYEADLVVQIHGLRLARTIAPTRLDGGAD